MTHGDTPRGGGLFYNPALLSKAELIRSFTARHELLERLLGVVRSQNGGSAGLQHLLLIGPRGTGKTTLLLRLRYAVEDDPELSARWMPVSFGEEEYGIGDLADFWLHVLEAPGDGAGWAGAGDVARRLRRDVRDGERLESLALAEVEQRVRATGRRLLLFVDNVNLILDQIQDVVQIHRLRAVLMETPWLLMVAAAPSTFESIELSDAPFYEFFQIYTLGGLSLDDTREVLRRWAEEEGNQRVLHKLRQGNAQLRSLHQLTGGNPRMIAIIYQVFQDESLTDAYSALRRLVDEVTPYYKHRVEELPPQARRVVDALARRWDPTGARALGLDLRIRTNNVSAQLSRLVRDGWVEKNPKTSPTTYQLAERFYNIYYLIRHGRTEVERIRALLRFMRHLYDDRDLDLLLRRIDLRMTRQGETATLDEATRLELSRLCSEAADLLGREGALEAAEAAARRASALLPGDPEVSRILGVALVRRGKWREALVQLENLLDAAFSAGSKSEGAAFSGKDDELAELLEETAIDLAVAVAASGAAAEVAKMLDEKHLSERWEPFRVALAVAGKEDPDRLSKVAKEIADVARQLLEEIQEASETVRPSSAPAKQGAPYVS